MTTTDPAADVRKLVERFVAALDPLLQRAVLERAAHALAAAGVAGAHSAPAGRRVGSTSRAAQPSKAAKPRGVKASPKSAAAKSSAPAKSSAAAKSSAPAAQASNAQAPTPPESKARPARGPSFTELESAGQSILKHVEAHPDARATDVRRVLAISNDKVWRLATKMLAASGELTIRGDGAQATFIKGGS